MLHIGIASDRIKMSMMTRAKVLRNYFSKEYQMNPNVNVTQQIG
jgi:hypothetical protein